MKTRSGDWPSISASKCPQTRPDRSRPLSTTWSASAGSRVSAWRKSRTSPEALSAPAFICSPRPRGAAMTWSARSRARWIVASRLPPSTTITSVPSARRTASASSAATMPSPSLSTGMMIESFDMTMISAEPVPASAGSDMMNCRLTSGNNELKGHTVRYHARPFDAERRTFIPPLLSARPRNSIPGRRCIRSSGRRPGSDCRRYRRPAGPTSVRARAHAALVANPASG